MEKLGNLVLDILSEPALLIGLFTLIGLLVQKKGVTKVIEGTLKATLGFILLGAGAGILISALDQFNLMFNASFALDGVIPTNEAITALALVEYGSITTIVMVGGMLMNIMFARFTRMKYIFLTGHHTLFMAALIVCMMTIFGYSTFVTIVFSSILLGFLMAFVPFYMQPFTKKVTASDDIALGHFGSFGYLVASLIGKYFGNSEKSTETLNVSKNWNFLRDSSVAISLTMVILFVVVSLFAPADQAMEITAGKSIIVWSIMQGITFASGIWVVLQGVKMTISELVPAFKGISDKIIPGAKPALDCPVVFPFAPNAVIIGFFSSMLAGIIMLFLLPAFGLIVIIPGLVPHFFTGAAAGVYGNATGGRRGAILGAFANGIIISVLPAMLYPVMESLGFVGTTFGDSDFGIFGLVMVLVLSLINS